MWVMRVRFSLGVLRGGSSTGRASGSKPDSIFMKIILDTNIIVGACLGSRYDNLVIRGCLTGNFTPLVSHALLFEYEDLIGRESVFNHPVALIFTEREVLFNALYSVCRLIDVSYLWRPNLKDEGG